MTLRCPNCKQDIEKASTDPTNGKPICPLCGIVLTPKKDAHETKTLPYGKLISGFRIERLLGEGGMGAVYLATQVNLERPVALKILSGELAQDSAFVERFFREARAAASLSHPNIVQAFDAGVSNDGLYYFAMEFIDGDTLEKLIERVKKLPPADAIAVAVRVANALEHAWKRQKLCHGDIKPENIMIGVNGVVKLADLGLAKSMRDKTHDKELLATPLYAPPEIIRGERAKIGAQSDMYSFGATLYHMLSGNPPFPGEDADLVLKRQLSEPPVPLSEKVPEVGPQLTAFVAKLLSKDPQLRPESWTEICETLAKPFDPGHKVLHVHASAKNIQLEIRRPDPLPQTTEKSKKPFLLIAAMGVSLILASVALAIAVGKQNSNDTTREIPKNEAPSPAKQAETEWNQLKDSLGSMQAQQALGAVQWYLTKHKDNAAPEAKEYLQIINNRISEPFKKRISGLQLEIAKPDFLKRKTEELKKLRADLDAVITQADSSKDLANDLGETKADLNKAILSINGEIERRATADAAKRKADAELAAKHKADEEAKAKLEAQRKADEAKRNAAKNSSAEAFAKLLAKLLPIDPSDETRKRTENALGNFIASQKNAGSREMLESAEYLKRACTLKPAIPDILIDRCDATMKALPLPDDATSGFVVDSADAKALKLLQDDGRVKLGKKIAWTQMKPESLDALLRERLLVKNDAFKGCPPALQESLLAELLLSGKRELFDSALKLCTLPTQDKAKWSSCGTTVFTSKQEGEAAELWTQASEFIAKGQQPEATSLLAKIAEVYRETTCFKAHATEIEGLMARFKSLSAPALTQEAVELAKASLAKGDLRKAMRLSATGAMRYAFLSSSNASAKDQLLAVRDEALNAYVKESPVKSISDARLPFLFRNSPGESWAYRCVIAEANIFPKSNAVFQLFSFTCGMEAGLWDDMKGELRNAPQRLDALTKATGPVKSWLPATLFGLSLAADRLQASELKTDLSTRLQTASKNFDGNIRRLSANLAIEQALLFRDSKTALELSSAALANADKPESRLILLKTLALLQRPSTKPEELKELVETLAKSNPNAETEIMACRLALAFLSPKEPAPTRKDIEAFKSARNNAQTDLCARIIADAFAKALLSGATRGIDFQTLKPALEAKTGNLESTDLWERLLALEIATSQNQAHAIDKALEETRLCANLSYTRLLLLRGAAQLGYKKMPLQNVSGTYATFALGCPLLSDSENSIANIASPEDAKGTIQRLLSTGEVKEAAWLAAASALANNANQAHLNALKGMFPFDKGLTWEERCLLKTLCK